MGEEKAGEHSEMSSLLLDIKQHVRRRREWLGWRVCNVSERKQRNAVVCARLRDEFRFHVDRRGSRFVRYSISLPVGIDQRRYRHHVCRANRHI